MQRINWLIMGAFILIVMGVSGAVIIKLNQPVDSQELKSQIDDLRAAASEGIFIASNAGLQNDQYFQAQLEDLEQNVTNQRNQIEKKYYDPSIKDQRQKYLAISNQVSDQLHQISLSFHDPNQLTAAQDQLKKLSSSLESLQ